MFDKIYLISAELNGVKNIDKKVRLTFYKQTIDRSFDITNYRVKAIFGENGCGKTALITAFSIARDIIFGGISTDNTSKQNVLEELINKKEKRYEFSCEFIICEEKGNTVYKYSLYMEHNESGYFISREQLSKKSGNYMNNSYKDVFIVNAGKLDYLNADSDTAKKSREESLNVLKNQSFLRIFLSNIDKNTVVDAYVTDLLNLLAFMVSINVYINESDKHDMYMRYKEIENKVASNENIESRYLSDVFGMLTSINDDKVRPEQFEAYKKKVERMTRFIRLFKSDLKNIIILDEKHTDYYSCKLRFDYGTYTVDKEFESTGIKKLISVFDAIDAACHGGIVFIDELDANINAIYLEKIIEYIIIYGEGQLCFSTHGLEIMDLLKNEKMAIDFLTNEKEIVHWTTKGNNSPFNYYKKGFIKGIPYNIDSVDFIDIFGRD